MRILIVLIMDEYVRNYVESGAFRDLERAHDCRLLATDQCKRIAELESLPGFEGQIRTDRTVERAHERLFNVLMWHYRKRSRTFGYRFSRLYRSYPYTRPRYLLRNLAGIFRAARLMLIANRIVGGFVIRRLTDRLPINEDLKEHLVRLRPDLVLMPCHAHDAIGDDLALLGPVFGFKTMFLVDNWDNLSSKSIFPRDPEYLGVWGAQSRDHAKDIHGISADRVFLLGTPRFETYYRSRTLPRSGPFAFRYALFCGSFLPFDELSALRRLDSAIEDKGDGLGGLKLVYRPHPYRMERLCPDRFREADFHHVVLDPQVADAYMRRDNTFQPPLDYYPDLLSGAEVVVGPLTTMLLEALICLTPVLALAYDDRVHYTSPHNAYRYYVHFEGIESVAGLALVDDVDALAEQFLRTVKAPPDLSTEEIDAAIGYYLFRDERTYSKRLSDAVQSIESRLEAARSP
jgi:hypothetical protein